MNELQRLCGQTTSGFVRRTAYTEMVHIVRRFMKAERFMTCFLILPLLVTDVTQNRPIMYLKMINELQNIYQHIYKIFQNGVHCARRGDRFWAGLSTDWMIEQVLMRSVRMSYGLAQGLSETQRLVWLMSTTPCRPLLVLGI